MPSWLPANRTDSSVVLRNAARAGLLVAAASSRRWRRAVSKANSTATKNALTAMSPIVTASTTHGLLIAGRPGVYRDENLRRHAMLQGSDRGRQHFWRRRPCCAGRQRDVNA